MGCGGDEQWVGCSPSWIVVRQLAVPEFGADRLTLLTMIMFSLRKRWKGGAISKSKTSESAPWFA
jgi:hypothetical protein